ncbi:MAG: DUF4118 domain-containing protein [Xanthobacteraceae bacterium]|nr:DUF4118 domain-containing protein [Xanthobacteraceae bacterium]
MSIQTSLNFTRPLSRYTLPFVTVAAAGVGSFIIPSVSLGTHNLFLFFAAIVITAWYAGAGPGWLSVALSAFAANSFFESPVHGFEFGAEGLSWFASFALCGAVTIATSLRRRRMEDALRRTRDELEDRVRGRTRELTQLHERLMTEMTQRVGAETALRQTQNELARASRLMTVAELTASIAHQINQPLAVVVANGEAAQNWLRRSPPVLPAAAVSIEAAVKEAVHAAEIIARIRGLITKSVPRQTSIAVNELVGEVLTFAGPDLAKRQIVTECRLAAALPPLVGDRVQLQQVLLNVVHNASDAMAEITDRKRELIIETDIQGDDTISIMISDSGYGISTVDPSRIFQPFYSTKEGGMGIGLSVCRTIVEQHGGSIRAMPRQPHGAILKIDLPAV